MSKGSILRVAGEGDAGPKGYFVVFSILDFLVFCGIFLLNHGLLPLLNVCSFLD